MTVVASSTITVADVDASIARVIRSAESIWDEWAWQVENETWLVGNRWGSWDEMRRAVYGNLSSVTAPRAERPELVARFRRAGLTQRETAETLGVSTDTVSRNEPADHQGQRGPSKTPQMQGFSDSAVTATEQADDTPPANVNPETGEVHDKPWRRGNRTPDQIQEDNWRRDFTAWKAKTDAMVEHLTGHRREQLLNYLHNTVTQLEKGLI